MIEVRARQSRGRRERNLFRTRGVKVVGMGSRGRNRDDSGGLWERAWTPATCITPMDSEERESSRFSLLPDKSRISPLYLAISLQTADYQPDL